MTESLPVVGSLAKGGRPQLLWAGVLVFFVIGDLLTTWLFLQHGHVEANPIMATALAEYGFEGLIAAKIVGTTALFALYKWVGTANPPYDQARVMVPTTVLVLGLLAVVHNLRVVGVIA